MSSKGACARESCIEMSVTAANRAEQLIEIARGTLRDLGQHDADSRHLTLDSTLDHDLGLDSLARVELFTRIEHDLGTHVPDSLFGTAETLRDLAIALDRGASAQRTTPGFAADDVAATTVAAAPPARIATLDQVLSWHRERHPDFVQIRICGEHDESITYDQLWRDARTIAGGLQQMGVCSGDTVALMLPTGPEYFGAFFGTLLAGAVPVPLYPPARVTQIEEHVRRHAGILANARAAVLITTSEMRRLAGVLRAHTPSLRHLTSVDDLRSLDAAPPSVALSSDSIALLQYTSGSTGQPKGVVLTHANIIANIATLGSALGIRSGDLFVSWLPLYHDMGLIGAWLGTLYLGLPLVVMSPVSFLTRPLRWLEAIHRYRGTLSAAPNFAYELCLKRITDEELPGLDLSTWRIAMNGAEAVMPDTVANFQQRFARCGLRPTAMTPVYGLAECSVGLSVPPLERGPLVDVIEREPLVQEGIAKRASPGATDALRFVSCGRVLARHAVRIVDDEGRALGDRIEGRLEFQGPSATHGYYRNPEATRRLIRDGWLDSGDRAYTANGEIYVTGRIKDIIIRAGRHIYPDEIEAAIGAIAGVRKGCVAVFGSTSAAGGTERVVVLAETRIEDSEQREALRQAIVATVVRLIGEPPDEVALAQPHTVLKTSSGKIRRSATREVYESGRYRSLRPRPTWLQMIRLGLSALAPAIQRAGHRGSELLYAAWFWATCGLLGMATLLVALLPLPPQTIWSFGHRAARLFLRAAGIRILTRGREPPSGTAGQIIVANHSSYLDGVILMAALPRPCRFVAKHELRRLPLVGTLLRRIGSVFVERDDVRAGVAEAHHLARLAAAGESCIFFPEGTFTRVPGLMPFHLGAFAAAIEADRPVIPIALRGARSLLPDQHWLPRRVPVVVHIGQPVAATRTDDTFAAAIGLRDAARAWILRYCGEPDLTNVALTRESAVR
jgi:1-acyl-sn-glycerol-3-phosphate acyltransferase